MKRKGIFQALSRLLILSMLLGLFPVMALAEDSYTYNISATTTNGTGSGSVTFYYTVGTDTSTTSETYTIGKDVYTITADSEIKSLTFQFEPANGSVFAGATYQNRHSD